MIPGLYSAATGLVASQANHEVTAHNLAHANVPGFRRGWLPFEKLVSSDPSRANGILGTQAREVRTDFSQGQFQRTGRQLDFAIDGDAFFAIEGPDGRLFTRNGTFQLNGEGQLITADGRTVSGTGGPITLPPDAPLSTLTVAADGTLSANGVEIGQLELVSFADNQQLRQVSTASFEAPPGVQPQPAGDEVGVIQGTRELANVHAVDELVRMMVGMRHYEASQRALKTLGESIHLTTDPQAG